MYSKTAENVIAHKIVHRKNKTDEVKEAKIPSNFSSSENKVQRNSKEESNVFTCSQLAFQEHPDLPNACRYRCKEE